MEFLESLHVELKEILTSELKKEVVAFANTCDGTIYIGINDRGEIVGVENSDDIMERAGASIRNSIKPDISMYVTLNLKKIENKNVIVIKVQRGASRPYYIAEKGLKPSGVYIRQGTSSVPASEDYIRQMIKETDGDSFEKLRSLNQNLTFNYADMIFEKADINFSDIQKKTLGIIGEDNLYTNLGLLLSDQCLHTLKIAVFEGKEKSIFKDRKEFKGSLIKQVTEGFEYIELLNKTKATFEGLIRKDERDYPVEAIREALLNAVVHREYSFGASTLINIYEDRMEFVSLGGIVSGLSLEAIMLGVSQSRNEKLANVFYRLHLIEAYGTGIQKIILNYEKYKIKPIIKTEVGVFQVVLPNIHYQENIDEKESQVFDLSNTQKTILKLLKQEEKTRKEIEGYIGLSQTRVITLLKELIELGIIEKIGRGKNIKYKIREK
ncbi:ATP-dependent DNA helicase RecG [Fusobacterium sp. PH5-7]|uniref:RNA-binding domain-containing protein n=1 Tax=Fusobacterium sp. PH5-7 TaxID=2940528 RepID=UPI002475EFF6|nr:RNA-binding domain-containing protein [Fusobacterium sp. PH5-7]MDH6456398.1 ATP-dependent DNA helicase RecG [Fusobacterium sp. PH5-7]